MQSVYITHAVVYKEYISSSVTECGIMVTIDNPRLSFLHIFNDKQAPHLTSYIMTLIKDNNAAGWKPCENIKYGLDMCTLSKIINYNRDKTKIILDRFDAIRRENEHLRIEISKATLYRDLEKPKQVKRRYETSSDSDSSDSSDTSDSSDDYPDSDDTDGMSDRSNSRRARYQTASRHQAYSCRPRKRICVNSYSQSV